MSAFMNITPEHFATKEGVPVLSVDKDGHPRVSAELVTEEDKALAEIALAIYLNSMPLHGSKRNVELVAGWVRQFRGQQD